MQTKPQFTATPLPAFQSNARPLAFPVELQDLIARFDNRPVRLAEISNPPRAGDIICSIFAGCVMFLVSLDSLRSSPLAAWKRSNFCGGF